MTGSLFSDHIDTGASLSLAGGRKFKVLRGICNLGTFDMPFVMTVK